MKAWNAKASTPPHLNIHISSILYALNLGAALEPTLLSF